ncbi:MAG: hypothetical protein H0W72_06665 [Planctomycetes bacterium]|nr:hypothetical protein [Planctomycetota bacterium]
MGAALMLLSVILVSALMLHPDWRACWGIGVLLGGYLVLSVARGCFAQIDADGQLIFGWGRTANLRLDLRAVTAVQMVRTGLLVGVGLAIRPDQVEILHRKGLSRRKMEDMDAGLGLAVVLEHLTAADAREIEALRQRFRPAAQTPQ